MEIYFKLNSKFFYLKKFVSFAFLHMEGKNTKYHIFICAVIFIFCILCLSRITLSSICKHERLFFSVSLDSKNIICAVTTLCIEYLLALVRNPEIFVKECRYNILDSEMLVMYSRSIDFQIFPCTRENARTAILRVTNFPIYLTLGDRHAVGGGFHTVDCVTQQHKTDS